MTYATSKAFRMALEQRLAAQALQTGLPLDRLRRRVVFERIVARLHAAEPGQWVLKGGMAIEVRLRDSARLTKDIDLGLREPVEHPDDLHERLSSALGADPYADAFVFAVGPVASLAADGAGHLTWRTAVRADLGGKPFGSVRLDVSPRAHELGRTDVVPLPNSLEFAGIGAPQIEIVDVDRHAAEKLHAMSRDFGTRENSRVRDLVDLVLLLDHGLLDVAAVRGAVVDVWQERDGAAPPSALPPVPARWSETYERLAREHDVRPASFPAALAEAARLWARMFDREGTPAPEPGWGDAKGQRAARFTR